MNTFKLKPILLAFFCTIIVLSCAGFAYDYIAKDQPFAKGMDQLKLSKVELIELDQNEKLIVAVEQNENLRFAIDEVNQLLLEHNKTDITIEIDQVNYDKQLGQIWEQYLFEIADIMANKHFAKFPQLMDEMEKNHNISAEYTMDEQYIYVTIKKDNNRLDHILPIQPAMMGVWSDETELE